MNKKIHSLTLLVNLGIYGAALPVMAEEKLIALRSPMKTPSW